MTDILFSVHSLLLNFSDVDSGSEKVFGGSVSSTGFRELPSEKSNQSLPSFGSISSVGGHTLLAAPAFSGTVEPTSLFGSSTKAVGFGDLAASGSGAGDFANQSG